jgi:hypothetical protein
VVYIFPFLSAYLKKSLVQNVFSRHTDTWGGRQIHEWIDG